MAHGINAQRKHDVQWWSRRPHGLHVINSKDGNKFMKRQVHKIERRQGKDLIYESLKNC